MNLPGQQTLRWCHAEQKTLLLAHGCQDLLALAQRRGGQLHQLLAGTTVFETDLHKPLARISQRDWTRLLQNSQSSAGPELPFLLGMALLHNPYIALSQAIQAAANLTQALRLLCYYRHQLCPALFPSLIGQGNQLQIQLHPALGPDKSEQAQLQMMLAYLLTFLKMQKVECSVQIRSNQTAVVQLYQQQLRCQVQGGQPYNAICLHLPLPSANLISSDRPQFVSARRTCRQLQRTLGRQSGLLEILHRLQLRALPHLLSLEDAAARLGISSSALRRLLGGEQTSFGRICDEVRQQQACRLLARPEASNRALAQQLGYSDEHNFRRAFKRWTGLLPSDFRAWLLRHAGS